MDGKHIRIKQPNNSGSQFYNYKNFFSIILLALVDADYKFLFVDIGAAGGCGDAGVFNQSKLKSCMDHNDLNFPEPQLLQSTAEEEHLCSYHTVGDDAFSLRLRTSIYFTVLYHIASRAANN